MHTIVRQDRDCTLRLPVDEQFGLGAAIQGIVIGAHDPTTSTTMAAIHAPMHQPEHVFTYTVTSTDTTARAKSLGG